MIVLRLFVITALSLAGLTAMVAPAVPALAKYGAFPKKSDRPINLILAGVDIDYDYTSDQRPYPAKKVDYTSRTDTLMLAQIFPDGTTNLLSIPRDTWVEIPDSPNGWGKINSANVHGGPEMLIETVQYFTALPVDGYVYLSLSAVKEVTNAMGGLTLDVPVPMKYEDKAGQLFIDLEPGKQHLNGEKAAGFLRFRKDDMGDIGRVRRQQMYVSEMTKKMSQFNNWWRVPHMIRAIDLHTKSNLKREQVSGLLAALMAGPRVTAYTVPGNFGRKGTWQPDTGAMSVLIGKHFRQASEIEKARISILNVGAPGGSASRMKARLKELGFENITVGNEPRKNIQTTISGVGAEELREAIGFGLITNDVVLDGSDITIRLGNDAP